MQFQWTRLGCGIDDDIWQLEDETTHPDLLVAPAVALYLERVMADVTCSKMA